MIKILLLILAVSADGFASAVGIGAAGIRLPARSAAVISLTGTVFLTSSVYFADIIGGFIPAGLCRFISSMVLVLLGVINLFHGVIEKAVRKKGSSGQLELYFNGASADRDRSKTVSCREALALSVALSADSLVTGVSAGLGRMSALSLAVPAFAAGFGAVLLGSFIGRHFVFTGKFDLQRLCGLLLIVIAFI